MIRIRNWAYSALVIILVTIVVLLPGCQNSPGDGTRPMGNPSAAYCSDKGFTYKTIVTRDGGEDGLCVFPGGKACEAWSYYRNQCSEANASLLPDSTAPAPDDTQSCATDADCVPAQCCHPTSCMNVKSKRPCDLMCTEECRSGSMDCGQGSCRCSNGRCEAVLG